MLLQLRVTNFALIDELELAFEPGLNVLTGETGAGKSILMAALELAVGGKAVTDVVRTGEDEAAIEAVFAVASPGVRATLGESGIDASSGELLVRRTVARSGRNRLHLNGSLGTVGVLDAIGERLLRVYGQHEHHTLRQIETHSSLLDAFAGAGPILAKMRDRYGAFSTLDERIRRLTSGKEVARARAELLRFQIREIVEAALEPDEDTELQNERRVLGAAEKLAEGAHFGEELLYAGEQAAAGAIKKAAARLRDLVAVDARLEEIAKLVDDAAALAEEAGWRLREYAEGVTIDPDRLEAIEQRLVAIDKLKRKYGGTIEAIHAHRGAAECELADLDLGEEGLADLEKERALAERLARDTAAELSHARRKAAEKMQGRLSRELADLGMKEARFEARFAERDLSADGVDAIEFYFTANPGEEARALRRVASGGELSRIMLALKSVALDDAEAPTVIFDEVDAGIGGAVAEVVGRKLAAIARERQVLCITHLPQIAAFADHHFAVSKSTAKGRTRSTTRRLREEERPEELARMLGGVNVTAEARRHAEQLLATARRR